MLRSRVAKHNRIGICGPFSLIYHLLLPLSACGGDSADTWTNHHAVRTSHHASMASNPSHRADSTAPSFGHHQPHASVARSPASTPCTRRTGTSGTACAVLLPLVRLFAPLHPCAGCRHACRPGDAHADVTLRPSPPPSWLGLSHLHRCSQHTSSAVTSPTCFVSSEKAGALSQPFQKTCHRECTLCAVREPFFASP